MKVKNEILKQARICSTQTVEELAQGMKLSVSYIQRVEAGEIENLDYVYGRYAEALNVSANKLKRLTLDAERESWNVERIIREVNKIMR